MKNINEQIARQRMRLMEAYNKRDQAQRDLDQSNEDIMEAKGIIAGLNYALGEIQDERNNDERENKESSD
jgi:hypothetical protein